MKRHPAMREVVRKAEFIEKTVRPPHPAMLSLRRDEQDLIGQIEAQSTFDATPAGAALVKFRRALQAACYADEKTQDTPLAWTAVRAAESELIAEIKRLQVQRPRPSTAPWEDQE